ncbi:type III secretion protein [Pseudomonas chlororaphis]|uniref:type III secretion protein n=1 Tax=Pseudomonas chlororaphis TaxID=587753 RepID=UPI0030CFA293
MVSLINVQRLLEFNHHRQRKCERTLDKAVRSLLPLERELSEIAQQIQVLSDLLASQQADDQQMTYAQLQALLRRQAVIRRQIVNLTLERVRVTEQYEGVCKDIEQLRATRGVLQKKHLKYQRLEQLLIAERRSLLWRQEENDIEELLVNLK